MTAYRQNWSDGHTALRAFVEREGHARVPPDHVEAFDRGEVKLGSWVMSRRAEFRDGRLSQDRIDLLEEIPDWEWDPLEADFQERLGLLRTFVEREGHARVPQGHVEASDRGEVKLGWWVTARRADYRKGKLSQDRIDLLEEIPDWEWGPKRLALEQRLEALRTFILREGHSDVPFGYIVSINGVDLFLGQWVSAQRRSYHKGELGQKQIAAIEAVRGWHWGEHNDRTERDTKLLSALLSHKERFGHPWPAGDFEVDGIRPFHEISKMQHSHRSAPYQPDTSEERVARIQTSVEARWFVLAQVFAEYPKEFPQSQSFLSNSALVAGTAVDLADSDEDLRDRERRSPEIRDKADQARAIINSKSRPVAESAVASLRAIRGWSDERFSDWEAHLAKREEKVERREEIRHARAWLAVWEVCYSIAPDLLKDPTNNLYQAVFQNRIVSAEHLTLAQVGNDMGVTRERIRQIEAHLRRMLSSHAFDIRNPNFEAAATALSETDAETNPLAFAEAMQLLGTALTTEKAAQETFVAHQDLPPRSQARAEQLARLMDLLAVPVDHVPQDLLGEAGAFWMGRGTPGDKKRDEAWVVASALEIRTTREMRAKNAGDLSRLPISALNLSRRPHNCLLRAGVKTVGALMDLSDDHLLAMPNMGITSVSNIRERLEAFLAAEVTTRMPQGDSPPNRASLADLPISVLNLSRRPQNCLLRAGVKTVGALMDLSDDHLLAMPNMGITSVSETRRRLDELQHRNPAE